MSPRIFITGVSGYIGGHIVGVLSKKHPEYQLVTLVRNEDQAKTINKTWPGVVTVIGDSDDHKLLVREGAQTDVVLRGGKKGHYVHTSGRGMLQDISTGYGNPAPRIYHDLADVKEIFFFDETHVHRDVDAAVISAGLKYGVPTTIVSPVAIHGVGAGPIKTRSIQIPFLTQAILKRGKAFTVNEGRNLWDIIHINDLAAAYVTITEEALKHNGGAATWGPEVIAKIAHAAGALPTAEVEKLSPEKAAEVHPWAPLLWGCNCRSRADRVETRGTDDI